MAKPWATAHEPDRHTLTSGFSLLFNSSINTRRIDVIQPVVLIGSHLLQLQFFTSLSSAAFQIGCCLYCKLPSINHIAFCWSVKSHLYDTTNESVASGGSKSWPCRNEATYSWIQWEPPFVPPEACSWEDHFHFIMKLFTVLVSLLECFCDIIQDIMHISGFKIIWGPSVTDSVSINAHKEQANNCLSYDMYHTAASGNFLSPNPSSHCWAVFMGYDHKLSSVLSVSLQILSTSSLSVNYESPILIGLSLLLLLWSLPLTQGLLSGSFMRGASGAPTCGIRALHTYAPPQALGSLLSSRARQCWLLPLSFL